MRQAVFPERDGSPKEFRKEYDLIGSSTTETAISTCSSSSGIPGFQTAGNHSGNHSNRLDGLSGTVSSSCGASESNASAPGSPAGRSVEEFDNIIFDFDSTVLKTESLEVMLNELMGNDPMREEKMREIEGWTNKGMNGLITFKEGLEARLRIAAPKKSDLDKFCRKFCPVDITDGMPELIADLQAMGKRVYILSGGFRDLILPFAEYLGIPESRVHAVLMNWDAQTGSFVSLNDANGFVGSKIAGASRIKFEGTTLAVGDGYTDFMLFSEGLATDFIAYTEHAARERVVNLAPRCAKNVQDMRTKLGMLANE